MNRLSILALALICSLPASSARAQSEPETDRSVERFQAGTEALREERYGEAAAAFRESYRLAPRVATMCNLALTYDRWGSEHRARALRAYRTCARDDESGRFRRYAEERVEAIERELALDEGALPASSEEAPAQTGPAPTTEPAQTEPAQREPPQTEPAQTELAPTELPAPDAPPARDHAALYVGLTAAAVSAAAFVVGIVFALDASATVDDLVQAYGPHPRILRGSPDHARYEDARERAITATALYVAAGIVAATSIALITIDLAADGETSVALVPTGPGLAVRGTF